MNSNVITYPKIIFVKNRYARMKEEINIFWFLFLVLLKIEQNLNAKKLNKNIVITSVERIVSTS